MSINNLNLLGSVTSIFILILCILIFISRLLGKTRIEYWLGILFLLNGIPLLLLLFYAPAIQRSFLYYIQISLMLLYMIIELELDYIFKIDFRKIKWKAVTYAIIFFASTGGMIGVASNSGNIWTVAAVILFFVMAILAFIQRLKTGM